MKVENKIVWLTGASSGIGEALAYRLSEKGAYIIISARRVAELERVKSQCKYPEKVRVLPLDLEDTTSLENKTKEASVFFGDIDVLINNSGIAQRSFIHNTNPLVDRKIMEINYFGAIMLTKFLLPQMRTRKNGQNVIISSVLGKISAPGSSAYAASKHALHGYYDALRYEESENNIKVTIICPGYINTPISYSALNADGSQFNKMSKPQQFGMKSDVCAKKIVESIECEKEEVFIGGFQERVALYMKRFFPKMLSQTMKQLTKKMKMQ